MHNEYSNQVLLGTAKKLRIMDDRLSALCNPKWSIFLREEISEVDLNFRTVGNNNA